MMFPSLQSRKFLSGDYKEVIKVKCMITHKLPFKSLGLLGNILVFQRNAHFLNSILNTENESDF